MAQVLLQSFFPQLSSCVQRSSYLWNLLNSSCNIPYIASKQFPLNFITFPELAVVCVIGVLIGIIGGRLLVAGAKSIKHYSFHYGLSFFFYSIMCGSGLGYHCVFPPQAYIMATGANLPFTVCRITQICHWLDICATSCSSLSFLFAMLLELGVLKEKDNSKILLFYAINFGTGYFHDAVPWMAELYYIGGIKVAVLGVAVLFILYPSIRQTRNIIFLFCALFVLACGFLTSLVDGKLCNLFGAGLTSIFWVFMGCNLNFLALLFWLNSGGSKIGSHKEH